MNNSQLLSDAGLLAQRQVRARQISPVADFLHRETCAQVKERLEEVNKAFQLRHVVSFRNEIWAHELAAEPVLPAETLVLAPESSAMIVHGLALHWSNDLVGQLIQMRRALLPDGLMIAAFFAGETLSELRISLAEAEAATRGGLSPRVAPMGELRALGGLLQRAGFALPVADMVRQTVTYPDPLALMHDLRAMGETNVMPDRDRRFMRRDMLARAVDIYQTRFGLPDGRVPATFDIAFLTGWAPSESQPRPLRPGSAAMKLADALNSGPKPVS